MTTTSMSSMGEDWLFSVDHPGVRLALIIVD